MSAHDLLEQARELPYGEAKAILLERAVKEAEAEGDPELLFFTRLQLTGAYQHGGEPGKSFAVFSRNVAARDADPGLYAEGLYDTLLWHFKWIAGDTRSFPEIPLKRSLDVLDDMERRYSEAGHGLHAVHAQRAYLARHLGDREAAEECYRRWVTTPRDELSDCAGCDPTGQVAHLAWTGRDEEAVALAGPVLSGALTCTEQPQDILTELLLPYLRTGRHAEAAAAHLRAYRIIAGHVHHLLEIGRHLEFCALSGNESRGLEILQRELPLLERPPSPYSELSFSACAALLLGRLESLGQGLAAVGGTTVSELRDRLERRAFALADRFDARNGTTGVGDGLRERLAREPLADYVPLVPHARRVTPPPPVVAPAGHSPEELLELATRAWRLGDLPAAFAAWERYDQVGGELNADRLDGLGLAAAVQGDLETAERHWRKAAELHADPALAQSSLGRLGLLSEEGLPLVESSHAYLVEHGTPRQRAASRGRLAQAYARAGRLDEAVALLEGHDDGESLALLARMVEPERALELIGPARAALRAEGQTGQLARASLMHAQLIRHHGGPLDDLLGAYAEVLSQRIEPELRAMAHAGRGEVLVEVGRAAEAVDDLVEAVAAFTALGERQAATHLRADLAAAYLAADRPSEAAVTAEEALALLEPAAAEPRCQARWVRAHALRMLGDQAGALADFQALVEEYDNPWQSARAADMAGRLLEELDRDDEAARSFALASDRYLPDDPAASAIALRRAALSLFWSGSPALETSQRAVAALERIDEPFELAVALYDQARILAGLSRTGEALAAAEQARDRFAALEEDGAVETVTNLIDGLMD
ncbi:hypothetical protein ACIBH1_28550 [Nonomuraea sp. NPDC050663]|uniref:hypothetical protein n=1 Tax=Nonomuraea sp. NPDC050663 TaxID=3364370 RepID=UPI003797B56D